MKRTLVDEKVYRRRCTSACEEADRDLSFVTPCRICFKEGDRVRFGGDCLTIRSVSRVEGWAQRLERNSGAGAVNGRG